MNVLKCIFDCQRITALSSLARLEKLNLRSQQQPQEIIHWGLLILMKSLNYLRTLALAALFSLALSCSSDEGTRSNDKNSAVPEATLPKDAGKGGEYSRRLCRDGFHFEIFSEFELNVFRGQKTCNSGFGGCFSVSITLTFDCIKDRAVQTPNLAAQFYPERNSADFYITQLDDETLKIYLPATVARSTVNEPSDFDYFDTGAAVWDGITLVPGRYPNVREGDFFTYTVPFTENE